MATEPLGETVADVSVPPPQPQPADQAHLDNHGSSTSNGNSASNGDVIPIKHIISLEEISDPSNSADVSLSGGSDTESSRADGLRLRGAEKGHERSASSAKRPATFKAVSVNKTFLASKASPTSGASKSIDRPAAGSSTPPPGSSALSSSRPRLVAKTGSGTRDAVPRFSSIVNGAKPATAPDPNVVWNKNRPPEPKKFTDEELKKYGIHMASRLNEDDAQGQNKWADIDDDDEDWAPEAITWGDGTKTTLPHLDGQPVLAQELGPIPNDAKPYVKPKLSATLVSSGSPSSKSSGFSAGRGLVLKSATQEKPTLVAKPPVPSAHVKSPWATLPPVDRASPGLADITPSVLGPPKDTTAAKSFAHQPKEIAADDFNRSTWREGLSHGSRELYNSHSGRYETVPDRRGSMKSDSQSRPPALLQRPHVSDQYKDTHSASQVGRAEGLTIRRRGSSSVSTGSTSYHRMAKVGDMTAPTNVITPSRVAPANALEIPGSPVETALPSQQPSKEQPPHSQAAKSSPGGTSTTSQQMDSPADMKDMRLQQAGDGMVDEVEYQKKLMRERIELARKRRQEEEAREEAAKKERIQKKLEALGPAPEKRSDKKDLSPKFSVSKPTQIQQREPSQPSDTQEQLSTEGPVNIGSSSHDEADAARQNYKMTSSTSLPAASATARRLSHGHESRRNDLWVGSGPRPDRFASWSTAAPPSSRNVWGSPDNDRGLGNGTFYPDLGTVPSSSTTTGQGQKGPLPIAPPANRARAPSQGQVQGPRVNTTSSQNPRYNVPGPDLANKWVASVAENDHKLSASRLAERVNREHHLMERGMTMEDAQPAIKDTWRPVHVPGDGTRRAIGNVDVQSHQSAHWKNAKDGQSNVISAVLEASIPAANAGIIGSGAPSQSRTSRFFPTRDFRSEKGPGGDSRPPSPSPPPPTMEGHPAYEGDVMHPHVSLPRPQPVVKLPPTLLTVRNLQSQPSNAWAAQMATKAGPSSDHSVLPSNERNWQARFHKLLHGDHFSHTHAQDLVVDVSSRGPLDHSSYRASATVSLPGTPPRPPEDAYRSFISKPMAEECFEEQEMGSLPQIRLPHRAPEAAWQPAAPQIKALPKKLLVEARFVEPLPVAIDLIGGSRMINIHFPGMKETKAIPISPSPPAPRSSRGSHGQRAFNRHRGGGSGLRGGKKEAPAAAHENEANSSRGGRGTRGYRSKGPENWARHQSSQSQSRAK